jgi:diguanylate cyclase (GGDEF)-like protein
VGLRTRLVLIVTVGVAISLATTLVLLLRYDRDDYRGAAAERAGALLQTLSVPSALFLTQGRVADLDNLANELSKKKELLELDEIALLDHSGRVVGHTNPDRYGLDLASEDAWVAEALRADGPMVQRREGFPWRVAVPIHTGVRWGTIVGTISDEAVESRMRLRHQRLLVAALAVSGLGLILLLVVLNQAVLLPIKSVGRAAKSFSEGDLSARAPIRGGDEIATLAQALNTTAERLSRHTTELEEEVARRTEELERKNALLEQANERLEKLAITDGLTDLYNHRRFQQLLSMEVVRQRREMQPFAVLMIDVDHFKNYNDLHGHPAGDGVLKRIAKIFRENVRAADIVARYGGEEFVVMLLYADLTKATQIAEKLREMVAAHAFPHASEQPLGHLSVSVGVAVWPDHGTNPEELLEAADKALYQAKRFGRDLVVAAHEEDELGAMPDDAEDA